MTSKRSYNRKKPRNGKRKPRRRVQVSKKLKKELTSIVNRKLDQHIEDKYILDVNYHDHKAEYDAGTHSMVINVSPTITNGDEINNRTGNKVRLKYLRTFFRFLPSKGGMQGVVDTSSPVYSENFFAQKPEVTVYLVRVNSQMIQTMTAGELRVACNAKFRSVGHCWQDYAQSSGQQANSAIKLMDKFKLKPQYRTMVCPFTPLNATGTFAAGPPETQTIVPLYQATCSVIQVPQFSYHNLYCDKLAQKVEIEDTFNKVIKYQYWYFVQFGSGYNEQTYNPLSAPTEFSTRNCWVFEDA